MAALPYYPKPSTPPPSVVVNPPPTPRFGTFEDDYQPFDSPKKSTRSSNRSIAQTLPGGHDFRTHSASRQGGSKDSNLDSSTQDSSATASKKQTLFNIGVRRVSGALTLDSSATAAEALGLTSLDAMDADPAPVHTGGIMITPAKTPVKRPKKTGTTGIARNLYPEDGDKYVMPTPKKAGSKKYMDSFEGETERAPRIYVDSQDRIPEIDDGIENPFGGPTYNVEPTKKPTSTRKQGGKADNKDKKKKDEIDHDEGMRYMFRGRPLYRKFSELEAEKFTAADSDDSQSELDAIVPAHLRQPLTYASVKPRRLFTTKPTATESEEEASTDVEERMDVTPKRHTKKSVSTPKAPKYAPFTPPTTVRTTRSKDVKIDSPVGISFPQDVPDTQAGDDAGRKVSPFNNWKRTKNGATSLVKKREGESITRSRGEMKKQRGRGHGHA